MALVTYQFLAPAIHIHRVDEAGAIADSIIVGVPPEQLVTRVISICSIGHVDIIYERRKNDRSLVKGDVYRAIILVPFVPIP